MHRLIRAFAAIWYDYSTNNLIYLFIYLIISDDFPKKKFGLKLDLNKLRQFEVFTTYISWFNKINDHFRK